MTPAIEDVNAAVARVGDIESPLLAIGGERRVERRAQQPRLALDENLTLKRPVERVDYSVPKGCSSEGLVGVRSSAPVSVMCMSSSSRTPNSPLM